MAHEKCDKHGSENVFFCKRHAQIGCGRCLLKEHNACEADIVDLEDITNEIIDTQLDKHLKRSMEDLSDVIIQIEKKLSRSQFLNKTNKEDCLKELNAYKKTIEDRIESQTRNAKNAVTDMYNKGEEEIKSISTACNELKLKITSKRNDLEASIRNNQYKNQYNLIKTLGKEIQTLTTEVQETKQRSVTEPMSLVCSKYLEEWLYYEDVDFVVKTACGRPMSNVRVPPPLPPRTYHVDPETECSSDFVEKPANDSELPPLSPKTTPVDQATKCPSDNDDKQVCGIIREGDIVCSKRIWQGYFGEMYKGICKPMNATIAVIMYICEDKMRQTFATQMTKLRTWNHPNLVKYIGIALESQPIKIVMEYISGDSLLNNLRVTKNKPTTTKEAARMCVDIATGMDYLIAQGYIHNCFMTDEYVVKISDYGFSDAATGCSNDLTRYPIKWSAPEVLRSEQPTAKSDVWSYGVVMWEIFSNGTTPYPGQTNKATMTLVMNKRMMPAYRGTPESIYHIMKRCWAFDPIDRIRFQHIIEQLDILIKSPPSAENWS